MAAIDLLLRVIPSVAAGPDGEPRIAHTAMLHPVDAAGNALGVPADDGAARFAVRLVQTGAGWAADVSLVEPPAPVDPDAPPDTAVPSAPWRHRVDAPETEAAARAVREASPADRREALIALVRALAGE